MRYGLVVVVVAASVGCATGRPAHHSVAAYGVEIVRIANQAQDLVIVADRNGLQPNKDMTARAMAAFRDLGVALHALATGLSVYDQMAPEFRGQQAIEIDALMDRARRLTRVVMLATGGDESLGSQLLVLFDTLDRLFSEIAAGMRPMAVR